MSDSPPNRKSSIPILKQTNKTKSFQSYVSLNLNDESINDQQHSNKSRSPSTSPTENVQPKMPLNRVQLKQNLPKLEIDNDIVITKLCDENKRLKDHQTQLISKYEEGKLTVWGSNKDELPFLRELCCLFIGLAYWKLIKMAYKLEDAHFWRILALWVN